MVINNIPKHKTYSNQLKMSYKPLGKFSSPNGFASKTKAPTYTSSREIAAISTGKVQGFSPSINISGGGNPGAIGGSASIGGSYTSGSTTFGGSFNTSGKNFHGASTGGSVHIGKQF